MAYCVGAQSRVAHRREALRLAYKRCRAASDTDDWLPCALVVLQQAGAIVQDLGRLALGLEATDRDAAAVVRTASQDDIADVYQRLAGDEQAFRSIVTLPVGRSDLPDEGGGLADALLGAAAVASDKWHTDWQDASRLWRMVGPLRKAIRHGSIAFDATTVIGSPGAGFLAGAVDARLVRDHACVFPRSYNRGNGRWETQGFVPQTQRPDVAAIHELAMNSLSLAATLASQHADPIRLGCRYVVPTQFVRSMPPDVRRVLRERTV